MTAASEDFNALGQQAVFPPSADRHELDEAVRRDVLHHEPDLVHVSGHQHPRAVAFRFTKHRAIAIRGQLAAFLKLIHEDRPDLILMPGDRVGVRQLLQQ